MSQHQGFGYLLLETYDPLENLYQSILKNNYCSICLWFSEENDLSSESIFSLPLLSKPTKASKKSSKIEQNSTPSINSSITHSLSKDIKIIMLNPYLLPRIDLNLEKLFKHPYIKSISLYKINDFSLKENFKVLVSNAILSFKQLSKEEITQQFFDCTMPADYYVKNILYKLNIDFLNPANFTHSIITKPVFEHIKSYKNDNYEHYKQLFQELALAFVNHILADTSHFDIFLNNINIYNNTILISIIKDLFKLINLSEIKINQIEELYQKSSKYIIDLPDFKLKKGIKFMIEGEEMEKKYLEGMHKFRKYLMDIKKAVHEGDNIHIDISELIVIYNGLLEGFNLDKFASQIKISEEEEEKILNSSISENEINDKFYQKSSQIIDDITYGSYQAILTAKPNINESYSIILPNHSKIIIPCYNPDLSHHDIDTLKIILEYLDRISDNNHQIRHLMNTITHYLSGLKN